jgi:hypothetical protein
LAAATEEHQEYLRSNIQPEIEWLIIAERVFSLLGFEYGVQKPVISRRDPSAIIIIRSILSSIYMVIIGHYWPFVLSHGV